MTITDKRRRQLGALLGLIITGTAIVAGLAGVLSFHTMEAFARPALDEFAPLFPITVDAGMILFAGMTFYKTLKGYRRLGVRLATHVLAGLSIAFNAAAGVQLEYQAMHATAPLVLIVSTEALIGIAYKHRLEVNPRLDRIRPSRWVLAPVSTLLMWRRMVLWEITSAARARQLDAMRVRQIITWQREHGRFWRFHVTVAQWADLRHRLTCHALGIDPDALDGDDGDDERDDGDVPADVPDRPGPAVVPSPAVPAERPATVPAPSPSVPAGHPRAVPAVPAAESRPRPARDTAVDAAPSRIGDLHLTAWPTEDQNAKIMAALRDLLDPAVASPYPSQAAIARDFAASTSQVSRLAKQVKAERVNGSVAAHG